jgi:hypothetical protein
MLYLNQSGLASLVDAGEAKITGGDLESAEALPNLFVSRSPCCFLNRNNEGVKAGDPEKFN